MPEAVTVTVAWAIKPELADTFARTLGAMFAETRRRAGFRNIRLLRSDADPGQFLLIEEWDEAQSFRDYAGFRTETGDTAALLAMTAGPPRLDVWALTPLAEAQA
jgi:quinol monooxygenase YgiN